MTKQNSETRCIAVHLPLELLSKINDLKMLSGKSQTTLLIDLLEKGLGIVASENTVPKNYYQVEVKVDPLKVPEFGRKLQSGELDTSLTIMTMCSKEDPTIGYSFWKADSPGHFESIFLHHRPFYSEVLKIEPVITPMEAMKRILNQNQV